MAHSQGKNKLTESITATNIQALEMLEILEILVKDVKSTVLNMFCELKKNIKRTKGNQENNI